MSTTSVRETVCFFEGCDRPRDSKGLCHRHYQQQREGKPLTPIRSRHDPHPPGCGHCLKTTGQERTAEQRARMSRAQKGLRKSAEARAAIAVSQRKRFADPKERERLSEAHRGVALSDAHRAAISRGKQGLAKSPEHRAALALSAARQFAEGRGPSCYGTRLEVVFAALLVAAGVEYRAQVRFGRYVVDFYVPNANAVIEADGSFWHREGPDLARDAALLAAGVGVVHHVPEQLLELAGWL